MRWQTFFRLMPDRSHGTKPRVFERVGRRANLPRSRQRRLEVECLEGRQLLAAITEFPLAPPSGPLTPLTSGPDGNLWFAKGAAIDRITPAGVVTEFPLTTVNRSPGPLTSGPDGNLWFPNGNSSIGRITPAGVVSEFPLPILGSSLSALTVGPDGNLWFSESRSSGSSSFGQIGRITSAGVITEFPLDFVSGGLGPLTVGPDGNLWFPEGRSIRRITTAGVITAFPLTSSEDIPGPLTVGPDGNLWFPNNQSIGKITTAGAITRFPAGSLGASMPLTVGPDGNLWFPSGTKVGRITTAGAVTVFSLPPPPIGDFSSPGPLTVGPDGHLYFPEVFYRGGRVFTPVGGRIDQITPNGEVIRIPGAGSIPFGPLTVGPDGNVWFPESLPPAIGRLDPTQIIYDQPLTATALSLNLSSGVSYSGPVATFVDADPITSADQYQARINWGDGSPISNGTVAANGNGGYVVNGIHTYPTSGAYTITVTITDMDTSHDIGGATAVAFSQARVVPGAPVVTHVSTVAAPNQGISAVVLIFSEELNPRSALRRSLYSLTAGVPRGRKLAFIRPLRIAGISYDTDTRSVTLRLAHPSRRTILVAVHRGLRGTSGLVSLTRFTTLVE